MATQTGRVSISSVRPFVEEGETWVKVEGALESLNDRSVGGGTERQKNDLAAMILWDALENLVGGDHAKESQIREAVCMARYATPGEATSNFTITVTSAALLAGLAPGEWDSYYVG